MESGPFPRRAAAIVQEALADSRVVLVHGPRQSGKTTLAREAALTAGGRFESLDEEANLRAALGDPGAFVEGSGLLVIDEFQRAGDALLRAVKVRVDRDRAPGRFLLTGSTNFLTLPTLSESLAGRVDIIDLWPLSQGEVDRRRESFIDRLFGPTAELRRLRPEPLSRRDYYERICRGGFPEAIERSPRARSRWFDGYVRTVIERDALEVARIRQEGGFVQLVKLLGASTATELNLAGMARDLGIPRTTLSAYLPLLETVFLYFRLPPFSRNLTSKVVRSAKVHLTDSGLAAHLLDQSPETLLRPTSRAAGPLLETFAAGEIARQRTWAETRVNLLHFRDRAGTEVDLILEARDGRVAAIEVKASKSPGSRDFRPLTWLRDRLGKHFVQGVMLYTGESVLPFGDRLTMMPVSALWTA